MDTRHTIEEFVLDLNFEAELPAHEIERDLLDWLRNDLLPPFEALFDRISGAGEILRLDVVEIDLGTVPFDDFKTEIRNRLLTRLAAALEEKVGGSRRMSQLDAAIAADTGLSQSSQADTILTGEDLEYSRSDLQQLLLFLESGSLSWQASADRATAHEKLLARVLRADSQTFFNELSGSAHRDILIVRLARQFPRGQLLELLQKITTDDAPLLAQWTALLEGGDGSVGTHAARQMIWESLLLNAMSAFGQSQKELIAQSVRHIREADNMTAFEFLAAMSTQARDKGNFDLLQVLDGSANLAPPSAAAIDVREISQSGLAEDEVTRAYRRLQSGTIAVEQLGLDMAGMSALLARFIEQDENAGIGNRLAFLEAIESHARLTPSKKKFYALVLRALLARELVDLEAIVQATVRESGTGAIQDSASRHEAHIASSERVQIAATPVQDNVQKTAPGAENQLRFKLAHCLLHGDIVQLESMWHLLYRKHRALTVDALRHYGRFERVRRQFSTNFTESILRDFAELLAPEALAIMAFLMDRAGSLAANESGMGAWKRGMWDAAFDALLGDKAADYSPLRLAESLLRQAATDAEHATGVPPEKRLHETAEYWIAVLGMGAPPAIAEALRNTLFFAPTAGPTAGSTSTPNSGSVASAANDVIGGAELLQKIERELMVHESSQVRDADSNKAENLTLGSALNLLALRYPDHLQQLFEDLRHGELNTRIRGMNARELHLLIASWVKFETSISSSELVSGIRDNDAVLPEIEHHARSRDPQHVAAYYAEVLLHLVNGKPFAPAELIRIARFDHVASHGESELLPLSHTHAAAAEQLWARMQQREIKASDVSLPLGELAKLVSFALETQQHSDNTPAITAETVAASYAALLPHAVESKPPVAGGLIGSSAAGDVMSTDKSAPLHVMTSRTAESGGSFAPSLLSGELEKLLNYVSGIAEVPAQQPESHNQTRTLHLLESCAARTAAPDLFYLAILDVLLSGEGPKTEFATPMARTQDQAASVAVSAKTGATKPLSNVAAGGTATMGSVQKQLEPGHQLAAARHPAATSRPPKSSAQGRAEGDELTTTLRHLQHQQRSEVAEFVRPFFENIDAEALVPDEALSELALKQWIERFLHAMAGADADSRAVFMESLTRHSESAKDRVHFLRIVLARLLRRETVDLEEILHDLRATAMSAEGDPEVIYAVAPAETSPGKIGKHAELQQALRFAQLHQDQAEKLNLAFGSLKNTITQGPQDLSEEDLLHLIHRYLDVLAGADAGNRQLFLSAVRDHAGLVRDKGAFLLGVLVRLLRKETVDLEELQREATQFGDVESEEPVQEALHWHPFVEEQQGTNHEQGITQLRRQISAAISTQVQSDDERHAAFLHAIEHHGQLAAKPRRYYQLVLAALKQQQMVDLEAFAAASAEEEQLASDFPVETAAPSSPPASLPIHQAEDWIAALRAAVHANAGAEIRQQFDVALAPLAEAAREQLRQAMTDASFTANLLTALTESAQIDALALLLADDFAAVKRTADIAGDALLFLSDNMTKERVASIKWRAVFHYFFVQKALYARANFNKFLAARIAQEARMSSGMLLRQLMELALPADVAMSENSKGEAVNAGTDSSNGARQRGRSQQRAAAAPPATPSNIDVHVENAGLILAWPYLPRLFDMLNLMQKNVFVDRQAAERAVHLLQFMVTGQSKTPEYALVLNKQLCGISTGLPIVGGIDITDHERQIIEDLIRGMIANWKVIGNTSVDGFRQSFLQRQGWMSLQEEVWQLRVETRAYDMLLDQLPWGISMVKHVWMTHPIHVKWR